MLMGESASREGGYGGGGRQTSSSNLTDEKGKTVDEFSSQ